VGRLITTTRATAGESTTNLNVYDDGDRLRATLSNWTGSDPDQWQQDCDTSPGPRDSNVCTRYGYDDAGRTISTTNALGQTNLTFYDDAGRSFLSVTNYDGHPL
jgi:YD repeat-containing protein